jgi:hypothetical protein
MNCVRCNVLLEGSDLVYDTDTGKVFCQCCASFLHVCHTCRNVQLCSFETNPSPIPKQVQQTRRMGNSVMSQFVRNPERVKITCQNGCPCWTEEYGCSRQQSVESRFCINDKWKFIGDTNE